MKTLFFAFLHLIGKGSKKIVKLQVHSQVQVKVQVEVHNQVNTNIQHSMSGAQKKGPGETTIINRAQLIFPKMPKIDYFFPPRNHGHCLPLEAQIWLKFWSRTLF